MLGLTTLSVFHTAISLVALVCGFWVLARDKEISPRNGLAQIYLVGTFLSAVTGLFIFQHGGFGLGAATTVAARTPAAMSSGLPGLPGN